TCLEDQDDRLRPRPRPGSLSPRPAFPERRQAETEQSRVPDLDQLPPRQPHGVPMTSTHHAALRLRETLANVTPLLITRPATSAVLPRQTSRDRVADASDKEHDRSADFARPARRLVVDHAPLGAIPCPRRTMPFATQSRFVGMGSVTDSRQKI